MHLYETKVRAISGATPIRVAPCPVCDSCDGVPTFAVESVDSPIVVCSGCGLGRYEPMLDEAAVAALYPSDYYGGPGSKFKPLIERLVRIVATRHIAFLSNGLAPGARVLDVGCGRGVILGPLADRGFEAHGLEVNEEATRGVDPRAKIRIAPTLAAAGYDPASFDQIVIWHVLEHLRDPRGVIEECHRLLKPGGRLIVAVPNFSSWQARWSGAGWFHLDAPRHLYQFPLGALRQLVERCGFRCGPSHHFSLRQNPFGWIQSALNRWQPDRPNGLYAALQQIDPQSGERVSAGARRRAWLVLALAAPWALALSVLETLCGSGATVHIVATRVDAVAPAIAAPDDPASR